MSSSQRGSARVAEAVRRTTGFMQMSDLLWAGGRRGGARSSRFRASGIVVAPAVVRQVVSRAPGGVFPGEQRQKRAAWAALSCGTGA
ncbi:hypothetical protein BO443_20175 [Burkholderia orbicola]